MDTLSYEALRQLARIQRFGTISVDDNPPTDIDQHGVVTSALDPYKELLIKGYVNEAHDAAAGWYHYTLTDTEKVT